jgi:hypothetical protein
MPIAVLKLKGIEAVNRRIPKKGKRLGQMLVFSDDITRINGAPSPGPSQHSGFCFRVRKPDIWLCQAGYVLPGRPGTISRTGVRFRLEGFSTSQIAHPSESLSLEGPATIDVRRGRLFLPEHHQSRGSRSHSRFHDALSPLTVPGQND